MGMDVYSKNGNYFRSNVWQWRPLVSLMYFADEDLFGKVGEGWHYNQGDGLDNPEDCQAMAEALSTARMSRMFEVLKETNGMLAGGEACHLSGLTKEYSFDREHLDDWIGYLKKSDGFEIF